MKNMSELLHQPDAVVIDVRTNAEFMGGHLSGSINIPLSEIQSHLGELTQLKNIIVCCASGMRSQKATTLLRQFGVECFDGGPWMDLQTCLNT